MQNLNHSDPPSLILRHRKENLKKCSLRGLETRSDIRFFTYPTDTLPSLEGYFLLSLDAPTLSSNDVHLGIFLIDSIWNYAPIMAKTLPTLPKRSLPAHIRTAYPRKQTGCSDPLRGLASIEALYAAYTILNRDTTGLLDHYHWKEEFLKTLL